MPSAGHADHVTHRQRGVTAGARRGRHRHRGVGDGVGGLVEFGQRGAHDHGDRMPAVGAQPAGGDAGLQGEFDAVVAALGAAAVIGRLDQGAVGQVAARAHRGADRLDIAAGFRVDESRQPRHPVASLLAQCYSAPPRPVGLVVIAVGVEDLLDTAGDGLDDLGVAFARLAEQAGLHVVAIHRRDAGRQGVEGPTDHPQMILADRAGLQRGGHQRQLRGQRRPGQLAARLDARGHSHPAFDLAGRDPQPRRQTVHHHRCHRGLVGRVGDLAEHPVHQSAVGALLGLPSFGHLHPKRGAHPVRGQRAHLGMGSVDLIRQRAKPLASRLTGDEFAHTPTLSNTYAKHAHMHSTRSLGTKTHLGTTRRQHRNMSEPDGKRPRLLLGHCDVQPLFRRDEVVVAVLADIDLDPVDLAGELVPGRPVIW